jgi:hypothetical protein
LLLLPIQPIRPPIPDASRLTCLSIACPFRPSPDRSLQPMRASFLLDLYLPVNRAYFYDVRVTRALPAVGSQMDDEPDSWPYSVDQGYPRFDGYIGLFSRVTCGQQHHYTSPHPRMYRTWYSSWLAR